LSPSAIVSMASVKPRKRPSDSPHPYLTGNFAPVQQTLVLTPCHYTGSIPNELHGGQYVRNGGNPAANEDLGREAHWFDGDGMLSGVSFRRTDNGIEPNFVNQFIFTDVYLASISSPFLRSPIIPSIATLINPLSTFLEVILTIGRTLLLILLSRLPGSSQAIRKISVANTGILFHDGRALATCESGPPMRVSLPGLETVGWFNGGQREGEKGIEERAGFGGSGLSGFFKEWTTAHPRVDPKSGELILFHSTFIQPYVHYSILPTQRPHSQPPNSPLFPRRLLSVPVPGIASSKMMHDFGVSFGHSVILDLPLSLSVLNMAKNKPLMSYDPDERSRFGVFPRYSPHLVRWFETTACCIFHTANTWDDIKLDKPTGIYRTTAVNMLVCRLTSAALVFSAGGLPVPCVSSATVSQEIEQCRLYFYQFRMDLDQRGNKIKHQFGLSAISVEFPSMREDMSMSAAKYIYGCSSSIPSFSVALGLNFKIDCLVKMNVQALIANGMADPNLEPVTGCVDHRTVEEVLSSTTVDDPIQVFKLPQHHYAQECRFVAKASSQGEDDGYLITYVFDESQLDASGECPADAKSEMWIIDAKDMQTVVGKIMLPQRVPYGLHGNWFPEKQVLSQRPIETVRQPPSPKLAPLPLRDDTIWRACRRYIESSIG
jgi:carotenoid cleavage dioxygenase-like enzyme